MEEEWIPGLSFPDASGRRAVKSTQGELSSPLGSGFHPVCVFFPLSLLQSPRQQEGEQRSPAAAAPPAARATDKICPPLEPQGPSQREVTATRSAYSSVGFKVLGSVLFPSALAAESWKETRPERLDQIFFSTPF